MNCKKCSHLISAYIDGELRGKEQEEVKSHLEECPKCFKEFTSFYGMEGIIKIVGQEWPSPQFKQRFEAKVADVVRSEFGSSRFKFRRLTYAAVAVMVLAAVTLLSRALYFRETYEDFPLARVVAIIGKLVVQKGRAKNWQSVPVYSSLQSGDRLSTATQDRATLLLTNGSEITLSGNSVLVLKKGQAKKYLLELEQGELHAKVVNLKGTLTIVAGRAQVEVRGTEFKLKVLEDGSSVLTVINGEVRYSTSKSSVVVKEGTQAVVEGEAIAVHPIAPPETERSGKAPIVRDRFYDDFAVSVAFNNIKVVFPPQELSIRKIPVVDLSTLGFWQIGEREARKMVHETEIHLPAQVRESNRVFYYTNADSQLISIDIARFKSPIEALRWWHSIRFEGTVYSSWKHSLTDEGLWAFRYPHHASVLCFKGRWVLAINVGSKSSDFNLSQSFAEEKIRDQVLRLVAQQNLKLIEEWLGS